MGAFVQCWSWGTVNRLYESFTGDTVFWLTVLHKTFSSCQGMLNALAYGFTPGVREEVAKMFSCCLLKSGEGSFAETGGRALTGESSTDRSESDMQEAVEMGVASDDRA